MVLVRTTLMWSYCPGFCMRQPRIFSDTKFTSLSLISIPRMSLSGKSGASPKRSPPYPQPTSMMETWVSRGQLRGCSQKEGCSTVLQQARSLSVWLPWQRRGQWAFQSTKEWCEGQGKGVELRGLMWARMRQSFFLGMRRSPLRALRAPSSLSDSSLCLRSRFIKEIQNRPINFTLKALTPNFILTMYIQNLPDYIERAAYASIYELNHASKLAAEQEFTKVVFQLQPAQYEQLLEGSSEHVVLAFGAVLLKNLAFLDARLLEVIERVNAILMRWYQPNGTLRRGQGDTLKLYVENTYGQFMGNCLRALFQRAGPQWKGMINGFLDGLGEKPHYRLFLYFRFIESFSNTVESIPYVDYRTHLSSFQDTYIPRIFEALFPYFVNISDAMDVHELSFLQGSLSLANERPNCTLEFSVKNRFTEVVFQLLDQVTAFRFNISRLEYDELQEFQTIPISFPQELLVKVMKQSFLEALYSILIQLMRTSEFKYQETCLNCLKKILLAKITYITRDMQTRFVFNNMEGVLNLLRLIVANKVTHRLNALHILQCTVNFVRTFGLDDIDARLQKDERYQAIFRQWLEVTRAVPLFLLQYDSDPLDSENRLFLTAAELTMEISNELKINNVDYPKGVYVEHYRALTNAFLNNFIANPKNILGAKPFSFEELKRASSELLGKVKVILTFNYSETFALIANGCSYLFGQEINELGAGNMILLIEEMIREDSFLQESVFGKGLISFRQGEMEEISAELDAFAEILAKTVTFTLNYQATAQAYPYLNNAMVVFVSTLLERICRKLSAGEEGSGCLPFINDELYRKVKACLRKEDDEELMLSLLFILAQFISTGGMSNIDFIFRRLYDAILLIKSNMKRDHFKKTSIYFEMLRLFRTLSLQPMPLQFMKWRILLFKIITALSFDDALDEYRTNIRNTVELLKVSAGSGEWAKILYDLTGIFESIDSKVIFRFFVRTLKKEINMSVLLKELFGVGFLKAKEYLGDVVHLSWFLVENHNDRIHATNEVTNTYETLAIVIPYWNMYLENEPALDLEHSQVEVYTAFASIISGKHVNICLLDHVFSAEFRKFVKLVIRSMIRALDTIESSVEVSSSVFNLATLLVTNALKPLFNLQDHEVGQQIHLLVKEVMRKLTSFFETLASGMLSENLLQPMIKIIEAYFSFVRVHCEYSHLPNLMASIQHVLADFEGKAAFLESLIKIAMEFRSNFSATTQSIATICVLFIKFYHLDPAALSARLGLNDPRDIQELERIFRHVREDLEDFLWLSLQMKDWLKATLRFLPLEVTDY